MKIKNVNKNKISVGIFSKKLVLNNHIFSFIQINILFAKSEAKKSQSNTINQRIFKILEISIINFYKI